MARIFIVEQNALGIGGHYFAYTSCVAKGAVCQGFDVTILQNYRQTADWQIPGINVIPAFSRTWGETENAGWVDWGAGNIVFEMLAATSGARPGRGDHVLLHTLGRVELGAVLRFLAQLPPSDDLPTYHILLRYDPREVRPLLVQEAASLDVIRSARHLRRHVRFHTDTERLTEAFRSLMRFDVSTLPIPFNQDDLLRFQAQVKPGNDILTLAYLGDARIEKNFQYIPEAIADIWKDYVATDRVRFVLQSNFNTPGGEPGQLSAVQRLGQFPSDKVRLIRDPMSSADYYRLLTDADAILIPYSADRYKDRSSGVLVEAMAAGKPVITSRGSWMSSFATEDHAIFVDEPMQLGAAIRRLVEEFDSYSAAARDLQPTMLAWSAGEHFVEKLVATTAVELADDRPTALVVMNGDAMVLRNGSSQIARSQIKYFADAGYRIVALFLSKELSIRSKDVGAYMAALLDSTADLSIDELHVASAGQLSPNHMRQSVIRSGQQSITADLDLGASYDFSSTMLQSIRERRPALIMLNYVTNIGVVDALGLSDLPVICEMHDIQSFQKAIYGRRPVAEVDLDAEFGALARCNFLISLNEAETQFTQARLPAIPCRTTGVFSANQYSDWRDIAGAVTVGEVMSSAEGEPFDVKLNGRCDFLYVSSNHLANVTGLRWFLTEVFEPYLAPMGAQMVVAGTICDHFDPTQHYSVWFVGKVRDLRPLYAAAKVVVLPITEGAGSAVKTIEALNFGRPVVATPLALRGMEGNIPGVRIASEAPLFAQHCIDLILSPELRAEARRNIAHAARELTDPQRYVDVMNEAVRTLLSKTARTATAAAVDVHPPGNVEFGEASVAVSAAIRLLVAGDAPSLTLLQRLLCQDGVDEIIDRMTHALIDEQDAPLLKVKPDLRNAIADVSAENPDLGRTVAALLKGAVRAVDRTAIAGSSASFDLFFDPAHPIEVFAEGTTPIGVTLGDRVASATATETVQGRQIGIYRVAAGREIGGGLLQVETIVFDGVPSALGISQTLLFDNRGPKSFRVPYLRAGLPYGLNIPRLGGIKGATLIVDVLLEDDDDEGLILEVGLLGRRIKAIPAQIQGRPARRLILGTDGMAPFGRLEILLDVMSASVDRVVAIYGIRLTLVEAPDAEAFLAVADGVQMRSALIVDGQLQPRMQGRIEQVIADLLASEPVSSRNGTLLQRIDDEPQGRELLIKIAERRLLSLSEKSSPSVRADDAIQTWLHGPDIDGGKTFRSVFAPRLSMSCNARFDAETVDTGIACLVNGVALTEKHTDPSGAIIWHYSPASVDNADWMHEIKWQDRVGEPQRPISAKMTFLILADLRNAKGAPVAIGSNLHDVEGERHSLLSRWTGPTDVTSFTIPIAMNGTGEFRLFVIHPGANEPQDFGAFVNGAPAPVDFVRIEEHDISYLRVPIECQRPAFPAVALDIVHPRIFVPTSADTRRLGINITKIEVDIHLTAIER